MPADVDNDGDIDYIAGNLGQNSFYRASDKYPVRIYAKDFNNDGNYDAVPTLYAIPVSPDISSKIPLLFFKNFIGIHSPVKTMSCQPSLSKSVHRASQTSPALIKDFATTDVTSVNFMTPFLESFL